MNDQNIMSSIFFEGNPLSVVRDKRRIFLRYEIQSLNTLLGKITKGEIDPKYMMEFSKKLTLLHARYMLITLESNEILTKILHHLNQAITLWSFHQKSKWIDQIVICVSFIQEFLMTTEISVLTYSSSNL